VSDDIRALSDVLARYPGSLVYADLAEALRRRGELEQALRVVSKGLVRHPSHADGLACLGRIHADLGDLEAAREAWTRVLGVAPDHGGALKGLAFGLFRSGDAAGAEVLLERALEADPADEGARRALDTVRRALGAEPRPAPRTAPPAPEAAVPPSELESAPPAAAPPASAFAAEAGAPAGREATPAGAPDEGTPSTAGGTEAGRQAVFHGLEGATADILLCDDRGLVVAGGLTGPGGADVSELAAAALAGVSGEAARTAQYLSLGTWGTIVGETDGANFVLTPAGPGALLLVRRDRSMPVGLVVRVAERALSAERAWLARQGV